MTLSPADLAAIRARAEAATKGPWTWQDRYDFREHKAHRANGLDSRCENIRMGRIELVAGRRTVLSEWADYADDSGLTVSRTDARFIAAARQDIPALCDALEAAWKERDEARRLVEQLALQRFKDCLEGPR